jgi:hypothetical protein
MIIYLTYNDGPSGIYSSQVIDVVKFIKTELNQPIRLISFVSIRNFLSIRKKIKQEYPEAIILPMFPKVKNWEKNYFLATICCYFLKPEIIIGRSVLATQLALKLKNKNLIKKVVYDGRGAIAAEWKEYGVIKETTLLKQIDILEKNAILLADFRIAVSHQLVEYWHQVYSYNDDKHTIIPCTVNKKIEEIQLNEKIINESRYKQGITFSDVVFIYSGSVAGWQSFDVLQLFLRQLLDENINNKIIFLSEPDQKIIQLQNEYPNRVIQKKVNPFEVSDYLLAADYGLLIREDSITNKVASPVKFAEYLSCGLKVLISENLGDFSQFVCEHNCGFVINKKICHPSFMKKIELEEKIKCFE